MKLKPGLYEQLINTLIDGALKNLPVEHYKQVTEKIDAVEAHIILSKYLQKITQKSLRSLRAENRLEKQVELCNKIVSLLRESSEDESLAEAFIPAKTEILLAIFDKIGFPSEADKLIAPKTGLSQSSLFTGSKTEPTLASEIKKEILSSDRIDILMSFIKWSGLRLVAEELKEFTARPSNRLRIITTTYIGATDIQCLDFLRELPNTELKVSLDSKRTRLHAKAYLFCRDTGFTTAYIGSSNISNPALTSGLEWNIKITVEDANDIITKFEGTFETYWNDKEFLTYTPEIRDRVKTALKSGKEPSSPANSFYFDIYPYLYQQEILDRLEAERKVHGKNRNLIVSATGTGKTVIAAFDFKRFRQSNPQAKFLFIAHRKEILEQSLACFRTVLRDQNFGELFVGSYAPTQSDQLFMSIQTYHSKEFWNHTSKDYYDYIIVDEFHHAEAPTYRKFLEYYNPRILLGLTATPERMDNKDILEYFDGRVAAEIRLPEAIDRKLLCPFHYFGVSDCVDLSRLSWSRGGYVASELDNLYTGNDARARLIHDAVQKYLKNVDEVIGLGFCVSIGHAEYMAKIFNTFGITSDFLTGDSDEQTRTDARYRLQNGELKFIFVVDLFNEGIDIPEVNTVLFLRPTESLTIFLQQLGRGLRLHEDKECLTVLDFISQAHRNYNLEARFRALMGRTHNSTQNEIENKFPHLPSGCVIQFEKIAQKHVLDNIRQAVNQRRDSLAARIATFHDDTGKELSLANFVEHYGLALHDIYRKASWSRLCFEAGLIQDLNDPDEILLTKGLGRLLHINSRRYIEFIRRLLSITDLSEEMLSDEDQRFFLMFHYCLWQKSITSLNLNSLNDGLKRLISNKYMVKEINELLDYNYRHIQFIDKNISFGYPCPIDLHSRYIRDEVLAALGLSTPANKADLREGVKYIEQYKTDLFFVTLYKSEKDYSPTTMYEDYAISQNLFHWQSQSTTSDTSPTGQRYIKHMNTGNKILLFVREHNKENGFTAPYYFLGPAQYTKHEGSRPMSITWKLEHPMPAHLWKETGKLAIG